MVWNNVVCSLRMTTKGRPDRSVCSGNLDCYRGPKRSSIFGPRGAHRPPGAAVNRGSPAGSFVDQAGTTVNPRKQEILHIDDTFCAAHGGQQLAFWNAHHDERGFASMHI